MAQWYEALLFAFCTGGSWDARSDPPGGATCSFFLFVFFTNIVFLPFGFSKVLNRQRSGQYTAVARRVENSPATGNFFFNAHFVALQLGPPLQFGSLTYQPIECAFISCNQSALWSCFRHLTSQLGEGFSISFIGFVLLIRRKTCVWNSFGVFSPMGFWRNLQECEICWKLSSVNAYVHMLES